MLRTILLSTTFDTINGKMCPQNPAFVWPCVPSSEIPIASAVRRAAKKSHVLFKTKWVINAFWELDKTDYIDLKGRKSINKKKIFAENV